MAQALESHEHNKTNAKYITKATIHYIRGISDKTDTLLSAQPVVRLLGVVGTTR